jgi:hypothetical protein
MADVSEPPDSLPGLSFDDNTVDHEAQLVVTDFLDYTEYLPSDLIRSFTLIRQLDQAYKDAAAKVHDLTKQYGKMPQLPASERPDAITMRHDISNALERAINCREASTAEATRISEVVKKHQVRLGLIKTKLQALPKPPSRDPTPAPLSPRITKSRKGEPTPKLIVQEKRQRQRKVLVLDEIPHANEGANAMSGPDDEDMSPANARSSSKVRSSRVPKTPKTPRPRVPKTPKERRLGSDGQPLHHRVSIISTSNALAMLTPPPEDAQPGSKWRPWLKLTEYELAVIRKSMKKNVTWVPSSAMINRYLADHGRGLENYQIAKATAESTGSLLLDEQPESKDLAALTGSHNSTAAAPTSPGMQLESENQQVVESPGDKDNDNDVEMVDVPAVPAQPEEKAIADYFTLGHRPRTRRATQEAMPMDEVNKKINEVSLSMKTIFDQQPPPTPAAAPELVADTGRSTRKRKRPATSNTAASTGTPPSASPKQDNKRFKVSKPAALNLAPPKSPAKSDASVRISTTTKIIPLAPEGVSPALASAASKDKEVETIETTPDSHKAAPPVSVQSTAAQFRSRRSSAVPKDAAHADSEPAVQLEVPQTSRASTRSGGTTSTKAASAEPPPSKREMRELRRLSNNDEFGLSLPIVGPRSSRRRPAPGLVTAEEDGKSKVSIGRRKTKPKGERGGNKDATEKKFGEQEPTELDREDDDPDEPTYCLCDDVSYGTMIACDNEKVMSLTQNHHKPTANPGHKCEKEWFHLECVGLKELIPRRQKWYCPLCRGKLHVDAKGNATFDTIPTSAGRRK